MVHSTTTLVQAKYFNTWSKIDIILVQIKVWRKLDPFSAENGQWRKTVSYFWRKMAHYDTDKVLLYVLWNFGNSTLNTEEA